MTSRGKSIRGFDTEKPRSGETKGKRVVPPQYGWIGRQTQTSCRDLRQRRSDMENLSLKIRGPVLFHQKIALPHFPSILLVHLVVLAWMPDGSLNVNKSL